MKRFILVIVLLLGGYCAYYFALRASVSKALTTAQTDMAEDGVTLSLPSVRYSGFPLILRAELTDVQISGPKGSMRADKAALSASPLRPMRWIVQSRGDIRVDWQQDANTRYLFDVSPSLVRGEFGASITGTLKSARITGFKLTAAPVIGTPPPMRTVESLVLNIQPRGDDMVFDLSSMNVFLDRNAARSVQRVFGPHIKALSIKGTLGGLISLDNDTVETWKASGQFSIAESDLIWGDGQFKAQADMALSETGPSGTMTLKVRDAQELLQGLIAADKIDGNAAMGAQFALLAAPRDTDGLVTLTVPITNGELRLFGHTLYKF